jgi:hypothetical protein
MASQQYRFRTAKPLTKLINSRDNAAQKVENSDINVMKR